MGNMGNMGGLGALHYLKHQAFLNNLLRKEVSVVVQGQLEVVLLHHWLWGMSPMDFVVVDLTA